jgi:hypothetical protein
MKARLVSCDVIPRDSTRFSPFGIETPKRGKRVEDASAQKIITEDRRAFAIFFSMGTFIIISTFWLRGSYPKTWCTRRWGKILISQCG